MSDIRRKHFEAELRAYFGDKAVDEYLAHDAVNDDDLSWPEFLSAAIHRTFLAATAHAGACSRCGYREPATRAAGGDS